MHSTGANPSVSPCHCAVPRWRGLTLPLALPWPYEQVRAALLNRTDIMCPLCRYLAQDYVCLGYAFPEGCLREACRATLSYAVQQAMAQDCMRQRWPEHCMRAGMHLVRVEHSSKTG